MNGCAAQMTTQSTHHSCVGLLHNSARINSMYCRNWSEFHSPDVDASDMASKSLANNQLNQKEFEMKLYASLARRFQDDAGVTTAEYAIGTCAATGLAGLLFHLLTGSQMMDLLWRVITHAFAFLFNL